MAEYKGIKGFKVQYLDQDPVPAVAGWSAGGNLGYSKTRFSRCRNSNCSFSFWWLCYIQLLLQVQQKNMMDQLGQHPRIFNTARYLLAGTGTQTAALAFGGFDTGSFSN
jgi:hypothetical protein